jgi:hypothetical protein
LGTNKPWRQEAASEAEQPAEAQAEVALPAAEAAQVAASEAEQQTEAALPAAEVLKETA